MAAALPSHVSLQWDPRPYPAEPPCDGPALRRLLLFDFRNYAELSLSFTGAPVVITGPNGSGKTNLLEAISLLTPGRGLRGVPAEMIDRAGGRGGWQVAATLHTGRDIHEIGTGRIDGRRSGRLVRIDGKDSKTQSMLAELLSVIWVTPQMDRLFLDGAGDRRRFFDRLVFGFYPRHAHNVARYEHLLRERARLLRHYGPEGGDPLWLAELERQMAEAAIAIAAARKDLLVTMSGEDLLEAVFVPTQMTFAGHFEDWLHADGPEYAAARLQESWTASRQRDAETGGAAYGPHRSDLSVTLTSKNLPAAQCSTGEQKAMLFSIILAAATLLQRRTGRSLILLIDEVTAHLDAKRRKQLFEALSVLSLQYWLTGTERQIFTDIGQDVQFLKIEQGQVMST